MTTEQKAKQAVNSITNSLRFEINFEEDNYDAGYAHALHNHGEAIYMYGYNEAIRWIPFEEKEPPLNTTILVKGGLLWDDLWCEGNEYEFATVKRTRIGERDVFAYYVTNEVYASAWVENPIYWMMIP